MSGLNWGEANKAIKDAKRGGGKFSRRFQLKDGESASIRFIVNPDEPFIFKRHYSTHANYFVCAEDAFADGKHDGCVGCFEAKRLGKSGHIRQASRVFAFSVFDPRKFHVIELDGGKKDYIPCKEDPTCKYCRKGNESRMTGVCAWAMNSATAEQLQTFERDLLGKKCAVCQLGKITVKAFVCPECEEPLEVDDPNEEYRCFECGKGPNNIVMVKPKEIVACSRGCKNPRRTGLSDAFVVVTRSGEGTNTNYNFSPGEIGPMPAEYENPQPIDFPHNSDYQPLSANEMAAKLNIRNPFKGGRDDDDEPPRRRAKEGDDQIEKDDDEDLSQVFRRR